MGDLNTKMSFDNTLLGHTMRKHGLDDRNNNGVRFVGFYESWKRIDKHKGSKALLIAEWSDSGAIKNIERFTITCAMTVFCSGSFCIDHINTIRIIQEQYQIFRESSLQRGPEIHRKCSTQQGYSVETTSYYQSYV